MSEQERKKKNEQMKQKFINRVEKETNLKKSIELSYDEVADNMEEMLEEFTSMIKAEIKEFRTHFSEMSESVIKNTR